MFPLRHLTHHLVEPDDYGVAVSGASLKVDFLTAQALPAIVEQFQTPEWALDMHEAHVKARLLGAPPSGWASIAVIRGPAVSSWYSVQSTNGALVCTPPGEPIDGRIVPGFKCMALGVPVSVWERCRLIAGVDRTEFGFGTVSQLPDPMLSRLEQQILNLRKLLLTPDSRREAILSTTAFITDMMTLTWELNTPVRKPTDSLRNRMRLARRAEAWMRDRLDKSTQVPDVCLALNVSRRELEYAFRSAFDQSPRDYLQALRLNAIRRVLQRANMENDTVIEVAFDHGVTHLSRFAASYRALFGENPKDTLHRHRNLQKAGHGDMRCGHLVGSF